MTLSSTAAESAHQERWYRDAIASRFFEREGFRRLVSWNVEWLRRAVPIQRNMRVLSLGCGLGEYELTLAPDVAHITGIDLAAAAVDEASRRARANGVLNADFQARPFEAVDFAPASFEVIYALGVLHHLSEAERADLLRKVATWLTPGGWFYARDPNARGALRRAAARCWRRSRFHSPNEAALDPAGVRNELVRAGLEPVRVDFTDVLAGPLPWILPSGSRALWSVVLGFDRLWLAIPRVREAASQFAVTARRGHGA